MRQAFSLSPFAAGLPFLLSAACGPSNPPPGPPVPTGPAPSARSVPSATGGDPGPRPSAATRVVTPSALAFPCKTDDECAPHRCNVQAGKCAYPCGGDADCSADASCRTSGSPGMAVCVPKRR